MQLTKCALALHRVCLMHHKLFIQFPCVDCSETSRKFTSHHIHSTIVHSEPCSMHSVDVLCAPSTHRLQSFQSGHTTDSPTLDVLYSQWTPKPLLLLPSVLCTDSAHKHMFVHTMCTSTDSTTMPHLYHLYVHVLHGRHAFGTHTINFLTPHI